MLTKYVKYTIKEVLESKDSNIDMTATIIANLLNGIKIDKQLWKSTSKDSIRIVHKCCRCVEKVERIKGLKNNKLECTSCSSKYIVDELNHKLICRGCKKHVHKGANLMNNLNQYKCVFCIKSRPLETKFLNFFYGKAIYKDIHKGFAWNYKNMSSDFLVHYKNHKFIIELDDISHTGEQNIINDYKKEVYFIKKEYYKKNYILLRIHFDSVDNFCTNMTDEFDYLIQSNTLMGKRSTDKSFYHGSRVKSIRNSYNIQEFISMIEDDIVSD